MTGVELILETRQFPVEELREYIGNPRRGDVDVIAESLRVNGQYRAIVVNRGTHTGRPFEVLAGNHTLQGAQRLEWPTLWGHLVDVDEDHARRIVLVDNRANDVSTTDDHDLLALLQQAPGLEGTGFDTAAYEDLVALLERHDWEGGDAEGILKEGDEAAWPVIKAQLPPHQYARFENATGETDEERILWLLQRSGL